MVELHTHCTRQSAYKDAHELQCIRKCGRAFLNDASGRRSWTRHSTRCLHHISQMPDSFWEAEEVEELAWYRDPKQKKGVFHLDNCSKPGTSVCGTIVDIAKCHPKILIKPSLQQCCHACISGNLAAWSLFRVQLAQE